MEPTSSQGIQGTLQGLQLPTCDLSNSLRIIQKTIEAPDYIIEVKMPLHSKARPRLTKSGHAYMDQSYRIAQSEMRTQVEAQWAGEPLVGPLCLYIKMYGEARVDGDNAIGFVLDAVGPSKSRPGVVWVDDRVTVIPLLIADWERASEQDSRWVLHIKKLTGTVN